MNSVLIKPSSKDIPKIVFVAIAYSILAILSLKFSIPNANTSPFWPPAGFAIAITLMWGLQMWPGIALGAFIANVTVFLVNKTSDVSTILLVSAVIAAGNVMEAMVVNFILRFFNSSNVLTRPKDFTVFIFASLLSCLIASVTGVIALYWSEIISVESIKKVWLTWWMGDVSGAIVFVPVILALRNKPKFEWNSSQARKIMLLFILLLAYLEIAFGSWNIPFSSGIRLRILYLLLILLAFNMEQWQSALVVILITIFALKNILMGQGVFAEDTQTESILSLQTFLCVASVMMMFISTTIRDRNRAELELREANNTLEDKIKERTSEITKRKEELDKAYLLLTQKTTELERSNKEFQNFAHITAHDLREPLRTITSYIQILDEKYVKNLDKEAHELMHFAVDGAKRMQALINDLLAYSNVESKGKPFENIDVKQVLEIVLSNLNSKIKESNVSIIFSSQMPSIIADSFQMTQLFQNLIDNAIKYRGTEPAQISISAEKKENEWLFSVQDNGIGMEKKYLERIFIIFQRLHTRQKYEGTGIGLAICKKIVERHGGKIWADSSPGEGSTLYFTIEDRAVNTVMML